MGAVPMALRNRRRLAAALLGRLIDECPTRPVHVLSLGAGAGHIITDAMGAAAADSHATLVDLNPDAFAHGRELAAAAGLAERVRFVRGDVRNVEELVHEPPDVVTMIGLCEYLTDAQITAAVEAVSRVMPRGAPIVYNSISKRHGTDRFFRRVFGLHMAHRSPAELEAPMRGAGFADFVSLPEPLGVYHVVVGRKAD
jgi:cyclopropane fatty-acyl-phospholipid synthase-like methyltransferase